MTESLTVVPSERPDGEERRKYSVTFKIDVESDADHAVMGESDTDAPAGKVAGKMSATTTGREKSRGSMLEAGSRRMSTSRGLIRQYSTMRQRGPSAAAHGCGCHTGMTLMGFGVAFTLGGTVMTVMSNAGNEDRKLEPQNRGALMLKPMGPAFLGLGGLLLLVGVTLAYVMWTKLKKDFKGGASRHFSESRPRGRRGNLPGRKAPPLLRPARGQLGQNGTTVGQQASRHELQERKEQQQKRLQERKQQEQKQQELKQQEHEQQLEQQPQEQQHQEEKQQEQKRQEEKQQEHKQQLEKQQEEKQDKQQQQQQDRQQEPEQQQQQQQRL